MLRLVIIADDLTGTLDAGAPFADAGLRVRVATHPQALAAALPGAEVLAISTRSREITPEAAAAAVAGVLATLPAGVPLFKKVDSRLKGNIAAELTVMPAGPVLAVPAIPEFGRFVQGGAVCGFGVDRPIVIAAALGARAGKVQMPDTLTPDDMARAIAQATSDTLILGARGAALALARQMTGAAQAGWHKPLAPPMVIVVGSTDSITLEQVAQLRVQRPNMCWLPAPDGLSRAGATDLAAGASDGASDGAALIVMQAIPGTGASGPAVAAALGASLAPLMAGVKTLVLTGGATAEAVLDNLGIDVLDLEGDVLPGLPLSRAAGLTIVTKSGGFGDAATLVTLAQRAESTMAAANMAEGR